jgi:small subunit ribosomal protein S3Ae
LTLSRIKTSQEKIIRKLMDTTIHQKATELSLDQFVQEMVLGKIASDIYNQAKEVAPLRHVGIRKSKLVAQPQVQAPKAVQAPVAPEEPQEAEAQA